MNIMLNKWSSIYNNVYSVSMYNLNSTACIVWTIKQTYSIVVEIVIYNVQAVYDNCLTDNTVFKKRSISNALMEKITLIFCNYSTNPLHSLQPSHMRWLRFARARWKLIIPNAKGDHFVALDPRESSLVPIKKQRYAFIKSAHFSAQFLRL